MKRDNICARNIDELRSLRAARRRKYLALEIKAALELVQPSTFIANEEFPHECLIEAEKLHSQCLDFQEGDNDRIDLTYLRCFSIDDPSTLEVDDALSLEIDLDGRQKIWIHVADPHRLIAANSCLDLEAKRRASSLYLSDRLVPMFPLQLGAGPFSLTPGLNKAALSVAVCLDSDGSILSCEIYRSWVRITYALSYNDADELIDLAPPEDPDLSLLHNLLLTRRTWRLGQGALMMDQAEGRLFRTEGELKLEITEPCLARAMVAEAMVLAGAAVANWAEKLHLAMPFRGQAGNQSLSEQQLLAIPPGAVRWAHQRLGLGRSRLHSSSSPHQALGLESYLQWTSPIRRYADLMAHRQWLQYSGLLKGTPNNDEDIKPQLEQLEQQSKEVAQISREDQRACLLEWLQLQKQKRELQSAIMLRWLREDQDLALVRIEAWAMELPARLRDRAIPGDLLNIQIQEVDPGRDLLHLKATIG
ncbi:MAG: ribonuclease catalytic domain-containing protein [Cyanobacteria bacterium]|nr:ribonuclease catalytic domain-containing protein [Cyanobacteriota bacterium]